MQSEYEREHAITATSPMGQQPTHSLLQALISLDEAANGTVQNLTIYEALGLNINDRKNATKAMEKLPKMAIGNQEDQEAQCHICLEFLNEPSPKVGGEDSDTSSSPSSAVWDRRQIVKMPCKHYYHTLCLHKWLEKMNTCPTCRHELKTNHEYEKEEREANIAELHDSMFS